MKGLELPVNILVIIIIAIIVLLALVALFLGGWTGVGVVSSQSAKSEACAVLIGNSCHSTAFQNNVPLAGNFCGSSTTCTVSEIASKVGPSDQDSFYKSCGCLNGPVSG
jgi:hypothetical protein